jgi:nucleoside-diphosphate-sugar epimerase
VVDLLLLLDGSRDCGVYNVGSGVSTSVQELAEQILELAGTRKQFLSREHRRQDEILDTVADISRARRQLNWSPKVSLQEGLRRAILYMRCMALGETTAIGPEPTR